MKCAGLGIPDPQLSVEREYNTSKAASEILVGQLLGGTDLNYIAHKGCVCKASADGRKHQELSKKAVLTRRKDLSDRAVLNRLRQATENGSWITAISHRLNITELPWEEFQDNILSNMELCL